MLTVLSQTHKDKIMIDNIPNLRRYVTLMNMTGKLFGQHEKVDLAFLTRAQFDRICQNVECDLSPENLTCDGELSSSYVNHRAQYLALVKEELKIVERGLPGGSRATL
jgi:hypothetical protein